MDTNTNGVSATTSAAFTWNSDEVHNIIPNLMGQGIWPNNLFHPHAFHAPSSTALPPSSSGFANEILGIQISDNEEAEEEEELGAVKEMMYKIAAMQPVDIDPATIRKPKRRNVRISDDPQSVAARHRRERISEKIRILQRLVPGGTKMDTASMLDEAIRYVKFLKRQIRLLQSTAPPLNSVVNGGSSATANALLLAAAAGDWPFVTNPAVEFNSSNAGFNNHHEVISD